MRLNEFADLARKLALASLADIRLLNDERVKDRVCNWLDDRSNDE